MSNEAISILTGIPIRSVEKYRRIKARETLRGRFDWAGYQGWHQTNNEIMEETGASYGAVVFNRRKHAPETISKENIPKNISWKDFPPEFWKQRTIDIARKLDVSESLVSIMRKKYALDTVSSRGPIPMVDWKRLPWDRNDNAEIYDLLAPVLKAKGLFTSYMSLINLISLNRGIYAKNTVGMPHHVRTVIPQPENTVPPEPQLPQPAEVVASSFNWYKTAKSQERWQIKTKDKGASSFDPSFVIIIESGLDERKLAEALTIAVDKKEKLTQKSKVSSWHQVGPNTITIECRLSDGKYGIMECKKQ